MVFEGGAKEMRRPKLVWLTSSFTRNSMMVVLYNDYKKIKCL